MATCFNFNNKFNMILDNQSRLMLNDQKFLCQMNHRNLKKFRSSSKVLQFVQKHPPEVFRKKGCSWKYHKFYRKSPVLGFLYNKVAGPGLQFYSKEAPTLVFSCETCEIFRNIYFEEHLRKIGSIRFTSKKYSK